MNVSRILSEALTTRKNLINPLFILQSSTYSTNSSTTKQRFTKKQPKSQPPIAEEPNDLHPPLPPPPPPLPSSPTRAEFRIDSDCSRPSEIPWQAKVANSVNLIGYVAMPVQFQVSLDGKSWAGTILTQEKRSDTCTPLWIPIIFEGDLAHIAACHLKEKDFVHVAGQLTGDPPQITMGQGLSSFQVMVHNINFVEVSHQRKESHTLYKQKEQVSSFSPVTGSDTEIMPTTTAKKGTHTTNGLWNDLLVKPHEWWDNRLNKSYPTGSDFRHKDSGEKLWIDKSTPGWILSKLDSLTFINQMQKSQKSVNVVKDSDSVESSWRDLFDSPKQWQDHRKDKLNGKVKPRYPDFKHMVGGQGLWLSSAPGWVLSKLEELKFDDIVYTTSPQNNEKGKQRFFLISEKEYKKENMIKGTNPEKVENSWENLVENPDKWWDNRSKKFSLKSPDFKHKETCEALWLNEAPAWVLPKLPPVKSKDVAVGKRETLLS